MLDARAFRHVHDDLELALVVERQHLENDELGDDEDHGQADHADEAAV